MELCVLGPLEAYHDGVRLTLGSFRQRSLLALLALNANQVVSTDAIIDELWGDDAGSDRQNALWVHVSNLRSALEPEREKRSEGTLVLTRSPGYLLQVGPDELDAWRFEQLLQEGRALIESDPAAASLVIGEGLALWRGRPYEDFLYESFAQAEIGRLEELRLEAVELRIDADLRRGLAGELVGELEGLARQHPLRERVSALGMLALYRSGRRADALRTFRRLRGRLAEELGLEPSPELQALEGQVLAGDPGLDQGGATVGPQTRLAVRGYELRDQIGEGRLGMAYRAYQPVVGREVAIKIARAELADDPDFIRRFEAEAELVARLEHPHIVPLYDYWREPGGAYLVMRLFRRGNLEDAVRGGALEAPTAVQIVGDIGSALSLAHRHGVAHGDIKPANILIDEERRGYLSDFGIALDTGTEVPDHGRPSLEVMFAAPERRSGGTATPRSDIYSLAVVLAYSLTGGRPSDLASALAALPDSIASVIGQATAADAGARHPDAASFVQAVQAVLGPGTGPVPMAAPENPYKGLRSFEEADAPDYFGRERQVERLVARLGETGSRGRLVAVVGPSGSGKSSAVHAGLLPALRSGALPGSAEWFYVSMTPGRHPFEELEAALLRVAVDPPASLLEELTGGQAGIGKAARRVLPDPHSQLLLVIDQFEELFTQAPDDTARAFLDALAAAVEDPHSRLRVVLTLRADFYDRPLGHRAMGELLRRGTEVITPMSPDELERAIDGPAERVGVRFEPGLLAEIVAEVAARAGALPLLQYALTELFEQRRGAVVELTSYRAMGGVSGALVRRAEALYDGLDAAAKSMARQVLLRLVTLGEGDEVARRRVLRHELTALSARDVDHVLDTFGRHRLLSFDRDPVTRGPTVEIAHEALLSEWDRVRSWIDEGREDMRRQRRLSSAATEWIAAGRDPDYLLHGSPLEQLATWAAATDLALNPGERAFLDASVARRSRQRSAEHERQQREHRLRRQTRRRTRLLAGGAAVLAVVGALAGYALVERNEADRLADDLAAVNDARRLSAASASLAQEDPELATLLALQALDVSTAAGMPALTEAEEALHWAIQGQRLTYPVADAPTSVRIGPNGRTGIVELPLDQLAAMARDQLTRTVTTEECTRYGIEPCPTEGRGLASPANAGPRRVPEAAVPPTGSASQKPLAGTKVTIWGSDVDAPGLRAELARIEEQTGIRVSYQIFEGFFDPAAFDVDRADLPDISLWSVPGQVRELAARGELVDLGTYVDLSTARAAFSDYLVDSASLGAGLFGLPVKVDLKGLVWYPVPEFAEAGYTVPETWDGLMALADQMVADGHQPWCLGLFSGISSGWPGTDWMEALVLRLGGVDVYDQWASHEIAFDHPVVRQAAAMFGDVAFGEGFVTGGPEAIGTRGWDEAMFPMFSDPPRCWMYNMASFLMDGNFPADMHAGVDADFFVMPPVDPDRTPPSFGGGQFATAFRDRPEVREIMRSLLRPDWGTAWASMPDSSFMPAHAGFDPERCRATEGDPRTKEARVRLCQIARDSISAGLWRYDASDLMPPSIGAGAFWQGMVDYIDQGPEGMDEILAQIEAAWP